MGADRIVLGSVVAMIGAGMVGYAIYSTSAENAAREAGARAMGFASYSEQGIAAAKGAKTPAEWRAKLAEEAETKRAQDELRAKEEAERLRQWVADAPKRAADEEVARKRALAAWEEQQPPERRMSLTGQSWSTGGFDSVGLMTFTVKNENPYPIKDFVVSCRFHGNSGTHLGDREHRVYETVKAKTSRTFAKVNIGFIPSQSARGGCSLVSAVRS
jgi:hypothetical protein